MDRTPVLYDRDCGFCRASMGAVLAWDRHRRIRPVALQSPEAEPLLGGMDREARMGSWHLVEPDGTVASAGAAAPPLLRRLPGGAPLATLANRFPAATERAYRWVAGQRSPLGRLVPAAVMSWADRKIDAAADRA